MPSKRKTFNKDTLVNLKSLEETGESGLVRNLFAEYIASYPESIANLKQFAAAGNFIGFEQVAHSLKSSSAVLGLEEVAALGLEMEVAARDKTLLADKIPQLEQYLKAAHAEIVKYLKSVNGL